MQVSDFACHLYMLLIHYMRSNQRWASCHRGPRGLPYRSSSSHASLRYPENIGNHVSNLIPTKLLVHNGWKTTPQRITEAV